MLLLNMPDTQMIQEGKDSLVPFQLQVDHPNDGICQFEAYRGKPCGAICAFTGWHNECRCGSHLYGQFDKDTNYLV